MLLYLLTYNNYYNRRVKKESNLLSYIGYRTPSQNSPNPIQCNFNPNDGITTKQIINWDGDIPDYIVASQTGNDIDSRWFVIEAVRKRGQQFELTLYRDTIVDYYQNIINSPTFIEKGMIPDNKNPLLFNAENMSFNQIKNNSQFLYDKSKCPWLVGYIAKNYPTEASKEIKIGEQPSLDIINNPNTIKVNGIQNWEGYKYTNGSYVLNRDDLSVIAFAFDGVFKSSPIGAFDVWYRLSNNYYYSFNSFGPSYSTIPPFAATMDNLISSNIQDNDFEGLAFINYMADIQRFNNGIVNIEFADYIKDRFSIDLQLSYDYEFFKNDKFYIHDTGTNKTYIAQKNIIPISQRMPDHKFAQTIDTAGLDNPATIKNSGYRLDFAIQLQNALPKKMTTESGTTYDVTVKPISYEADRNNNVEIISFGTLVSYTLKEVFNTAHKTIIPQDRLHLNDQPYDMFCIPYSDDLQYDFEGRRFNASKDLAIKTVTAIATQFTGAAVYDIQILPYCPIQNIIYIDDDQVIIDPKYANYTPITKIDSTDHEGYIFWCMESKFNFSIPFEIPDEQNPIEKKVKSMTEFYRLVSPTQGLEYTFDPMKNNGVSQMNVQCTYKPYSSNIRICPEWNVGSLYENVNQTNSQDGLIILEDCSLTQLTDRWAEYELNNKNYRNIFERQIQSMEYNRDVNLGLGIANAFVGSISGAVGGAIAGNMAGIGGVAGGVIGGVASAVGGMIDTQANYALANEAIDLTQDNFNYQLGNVKALPLSLSKVSSFAVNNSFVPLIEFWSTTDTEKKVAYNKIKYQGMTISVIDKISSYRSEDGDSYIKGQIIRVEGLEDDFHVANTIAKELHQGLYLN